MSDDRDSESQLRTMLAGPPGRPRAGAKVHRALGTAQPGAKPVLSQVAAAVAILIRRRRRPIVELGYTTHMRIKRNLHNLEKRASVKEFLEELRQQQSAIAALPQPQEPING